MSDFPASQAYRQLDRSSTDSFPGLQSAKLYGPTEDITRGPSLEKVHLGHIFLTSPLPVVSQISAQGHMASRSSPIPSPIRAEQDIPFRASVDRDTMESSTPEPNGSSSGPENGAARDSNDAPEVPSGHIPDHSLHPFIENPLENAAQGTANPSKTNSQVTEPCGLPTSRIPTIRVQQPTRDPSQALDEVVPERPIETEFAEDFVKSVLRPVSASPDITTAAPDAHMEASPERHAIVTQIPQSPTASHRAVFAKPSTNRLLLRKFRNRVAAEPLLNLVLGRSVAKVAKPALRSAANPTEVVLDVEDADSIDNEVTRSRGCRI